MVVSQLQDRTIEAALERARALDEQAKTDVRSGQPKSAAAAWEASADALRAAANRIHLQLAERLEFAAGIHAHLGEMEHGRRVARLAATSLQIARQQEIIEAGEFAPWIARLGQMFCVLSAWPDALDLLAGAEAVYAGLHADVIEDPRARMQGLGALSMACRMGNPSPHVLEIMKQGVAWAEQRTDAKAPIEQQVQLAQLLNIYGDLLMQRSAITDAEEILARCAAHVAVLADSTDGPAIRNLSAAVLNKYGKVKILRGDRQAGEAALQRSVETMRVLVEIDGLVSLRDDYEAAKADLAQASRPI